MKNSYQKNPFIGLSHRGNSKKFIENSYEAFNSVIQMGFKYIETDLRMTLDKEVIAFHDPDLKRLFNLDLQVKDLTFNEISNLFREKKYLIEIFRKYNSKKKKLLLKLLSSTENILRKESGLSLVTGLRFILNIKKITVS